MKKLLLMLALILPTACPGFTNCPGTDNYARARAIIGGAQVAVGIADAVFSSWSAAQTDAEKVKSATDSYNKIKTTVLTALKLAMDGVDIAQQAGAEPDISKLIVAAETAYQDLRKLIDSLMAYKAKVAPPTSGPVKVVAPPKLDNTKKLYDQLPKTLLK